MQIGKFMNKEKYYTHKREPFFEIANNYISKYSRVLDIGAGAGAFSMYCDRDDFYLFDGNPQTVDELKEKYNNVEYGLLPNLPYDSKFFDVIHCSHVVEHLEPKIFYDTLVEMDRCLKIGGCLVISAPLMWSGFYDDLSHIKPYNPNVYKNYLCSKRGVSRTRNVISSSYEIEKLVFRYLPTNNNFNFYNTKDNRLISIIVKVINKMKSKGFSFLEKTGYTIVLKKS